MFSIPAASGVGLQALLATPSRLPPNGLVPRASTVAIGTLVPLYCSLRLLAPRAASTEAEHSTELRGWLRYWTAFGSFNLLEVFSDKLVFWIPYYVQLKWLSLLWLQMPVRSGCVFVTDKLLVPFYSKYLHRYDRQIQYLRRLIVGLIEMQVIEMEILYGKAKYILQRFWRSAGGPDSDPTEPPRVEEIDDDQEIDSSGAVLVD